MQSTRQFHTDNELHATFGFLFLSETAYDATAAVSSFPEDPRAIRAIPANRNAFRATVRGVAGASAEFLFSQLFFRVYEASPVVFVHVFHTPRQ